MNASCAWCNERVGTLINIDVERRRPIAGDTVSQTVSVHPRHEAPVRSYFAGERAHGGTVTYTLLGLTLLLMVGANAASGLVASQRLGEGVLLGGVGALLVVMGAVLAAYPYPTMATLRVLGIRRAQAITRWVGVGCVGLGGWMVWASRFLV